MAVLLIVGVALTVYAWVLSLIGTVIPYWTYEDQGVQYQQAGLWKTCTVHNGNKDCIKLTEGWIRSVQAFMVMTVIFLFLSMVSGCLRLKNEAMNKVYTISTLAALSGGILLTISLIVYGVKNNANSSKFSAGFYLSLISAVTAFIATLVLSKSNTGNRTDGYTAVGP